MAIPVYPVFLHLAQQPVLIVGGGKVAMRKARGLIQAQAAITVISPVFAAELAQLPNLVLRREKYQSAGMNGPNAPQWRLVFAATDDPQVNEQVAADARKCQVFCCRCDASEEGDFSNASVWRKEPVVVAVSTSGASPLLAAKIAQTLTQTLPFTLVEMAE
ncbi:MAG: bifunctional precorrin-2 dehydrogenase/sirohydrochlorin ferrochelatase, partial [Phycisphaerae bacterium]|nr:bifunctional precorrin-2 dehydrogenase/sirohydrochlorin ferrochelatase [Phycisphaerae bacterium]